MKNFIDIIDLGFVWRRMIQDNQDFLPAPRAPSLGQGACPWLLPAPDSSPSFIASTPMIMPAAAAPDDLERKNSIVKSEPATAVVTQIESASIKEGCASGDPYAANIASLVHQSSGDGGQPM